MWPHFTFREDWFDSNGSFETFLDEDGDGIIEYQGDPPQIWDLLCPICWGFYELYHLFHLHSQHLM